MVLKDLYHCAINYNGPQQGLDCVHHAIDFAPVRALHHFVLMLTHFSFNVIHWSYSRGLGYYARYFILPIFPSLWTILSNIYVQTMIFAFALSFVSFMFVQVEGERTPYTKAYKRLTSPTISSLIDQYDEKYSSGVDQGEDEQGTPNWRIKGLFVYPIKSCRGVEVDKIEILEHGCKYDRSFVFAQSDLKDPGWKFITMRNHPKLAHVGIEIWEPNVDHKDHARVGQSDGFFVISYPVQKTPLDVLRHLSSAISQGTFSPWVRHKFRVPFSPSPSDFNRLQLQSEPVKFFSDSPTGINMTPYIPPNLLRELARFLDVTNPLALFRKDPRVMREVHKNADDIEGLGYQAHTNFADSFPINIMNLASVHDVASKLPQGAVDALSVARFRCNFLRKSLYSYQSRQTLTNTRAQVTGPEAYEEETWKSIQLVPPPSSSTSSTSDPLLFHVTNRTTRCNLPNTDPDQTDPRLPNVIKDRTSIGHNQPLQTLIKHRAVDEGVKGKSCLGMMVVPGKGSVGREVVVGSEIRVGTRGEHIGRTK